MLIELEREAALGEVGRGLEDVVKLVFAEPGFRSDLQREVAVSVR